MVVAHADRLQPFFVLGVPVAHRLRGRDERVAALLRDGHLVLRALEDLV